METANEYVSAAEALILRYQETRDKSEFNCRGADELYEWLRDLAVQRIIPNRGLDPDEIAHRIVLNILKHKYSYEPMEGSTFGNWLAKIVGNMVTNQIVEQNQVRRTGRTKNRVRRTGGPKMMDIEIIDDPIDPADETGDLLVREEEIALAHHLVSQLPALQRDIITLTYLGGMTEERAAKQLGIPTSTLNHKKERALKTMAKWVKNGAAPSKFKVA